MNCNEVGFLNSSRTANNIRFRIRHIEVRILPPQPASPAFGQVSQETRGRAGNPGLSRIRFRLWTPGLPRRRRKSAKVSGPLRDISRFGETLGGDRFDHDCRPTDSRSSRLLGRESLKSGVTRVRLQPDGGNRDCGDNFVLSAARRSPALNAICYG
jgi:hypothetical protein